MASYQARGRDPLFDTGTALVLEKRGRELLGVVMMLLGLAGAAMIASYTPDDPSWLSATDAPVQNWMGRFGAYVAAPLFMIVGGGAWALALTLLIWGGRNIFHRGEGRPFLCVILAPVWMLVCSVYAAGLPQGAGWTHHFGLGGLFGDMVMGSFLMALPLAPAVGLKIMMLVLGLAILALGGFVLGFTREELKAIGRFLLVGLVATYAGLLRLTGYGARGVFGAAQRMQGAHQARRAEAATRKATAEAEAQSHAMAEATAPVDVAVHAPVMPPAEPPLMTSLGGSEMAGDGALPRARRVHRALPPLSPDPDPGKPGPEGHDRPRAPEADAADTGSFAAPPAPRPKAGGKAGRSFLSLMPLTRRKADDAPMPQAEWVTNDVAHDVEAPGADRISAKIASAVKTRRPLASALSARKPDPSKPLTGGRGHGPQPLIVAPAPRVPTAAGLPPEPPLSATGLAPEPRLRADPRPPHDLRAPQRSAGDMQAPAAMLDGMMQDPTQVLGGAAALAGLPPAPRPSGLRPPLSAPDRGPDRGPDIGVVPEVQGFAADPAPIGREAPGPATDRAYGLDADHVPAASPVPDRIAPAPMPAAARAAAPLAPVPSPPPALPAFEDDSAEVLEDPYGELSDFDDYGDDVSALAVPPAPPMPSPAPMPRVPAAPTKALVQKPARKPIQPSRRAQAEAQPQLQFEDTQPDYELPPLSLLMSPDQIERHHLSDEALEENARMLESVLDDYGVKGEITSVRPGPVVTMYELEPAPGLKASRVIGLADDIARSMSALSARVSTVPGRSVIGIELPNDKREMVCFREILAGRDYGDGNHKLPLALGKDIGGDPMVANLAKMPHLLIAGTTGSGKSVAINTMILSLLYKLTPQDCRLIMIDPKMLELSVYDGIPHLLSPVVTDPKKAVVALKWVVGEMEDRYRKMSKMGVRNIDGYNSRVADALKKGELFSRTVQTGFDDDTGEPVFETEEFEPKKMPYIVVIVDEMADLMMVAGKEIEACIQRLAQMARASGIHLIMATQRPSVDVITGTIKANFPTRISFQVTSKIDSRTILGEMGAEQLLGMGDMLYMAGGAKITRCHGPFVSDEEVEEIVNHLKAFGPPEYIGGVVEGPDDEKADNIDAVLGLSTGGNTNGEDALYDQAVQIVIKDRKCSTSYIQRKLGIGYNKAARLVEQMEDESVVSAANHVGKREILVPEQG